MSNLITPNQTASDAEGDQSELVESGIGYSDLESPNVSDVQLESDSENSEEENIDENEDDNATIEADKGIVLPHWVNRLKAYYDYVSQTNTLETKNKRNRIKYTLCCLLCKSADSSTPATTPRPSSSKKKRSSTRNEGQTITSKSVNSFKRHLQLIHPKDHNPKVYARLPKSFDRVRATRPGETILTSVIGIPGRKQTKTESPLLKPYDLNSVKQKEFQKAVLDMIVLESLPLSFADSEGLYQVIQTADPRLTLPSRRTIGRLLTEKHEQVTEHVLKAMKTLRRGSAHLMLDMWTTRQNMSVIGVQVRFIRNWKIEQLLLGFKHFRGPHDAKSIRRKLEDLLVKKYQLPLYHFATVTADNASAIHNAFRLQYFEHDALTDADGTTSETTLSSYDDSREEEDEEEPSVPSEFLFEDDLLIDKSLERNVLDAIYFIPENHAAQTPITRNSCLAHLLQLGIRDALKEKFVCDMAKKFNSIVTWLNKSSKHYDTFKDMSGLSLVKPCETRWNSLYHSLKRFLRDGKRKTKKPLAMIANDVIKSVRKSGTITSNKKLPQLITNYDMDAARVIVDILEPFANLTDEWQSNRVTSSIVIMFFLNAFKVFTDIEISEELEKSAELLLFKRRLGKCILERFSFDKARGQAVLNENGKQRRIVTHDIFHDTNYIVSALLDPRIKTLPFGDNSKDPGVKNGIPTKEEAVAMLKEQVEKMRAEFPDIIVLTPVDESCANASQTTSSSTPPSQPPQKKRRSMWEMVNKELEQSKKVQSELDEVDLYINGMSSLLPSDNPLAFWNLNEERLPVLSSLAKRFLAIPATSASVERLFSVAGSVIRCRRARMNISTAEQLLGYQEHLSNGLSSLRIN